MVLVKKCILSEKESKESQKSEPIVVTSKKPSVLHVQMDKLEDIPITEQSMRSNIILIWKCPSLARHGKLALPTESLTTSDINQLQSSSLYWETEVNDKILLQSDDLFTSTVRDVINIKTVVTNRSSVDYKQLKVIFKDRLLSSKITTNHNILLNCSFRLLLKHFKKTLLASLSYMMAQYYGLVTIRLASIFYQNKIR